MDAEEAARGGSGYGGSGYGGNGWGGGDGDGWEGDRKAEMREDAGAVGEDGEARQLRQVPLGALGGLHLGTRPPPGAFGPR